MLGPVIFLLLAILALPYAAYLVAGYLFVPFRSPAKKQSVTVPVSIVLPTYNEAELVEDTLTHLCALDYPDELLEIVVVDSSDDDTATRVERFFADRTAPDFVLIREPDRGGVARAVTRGVAEATHSIIFRTDCDARLEANVIGHAVANLQDPAVGGVTGRQSRVIGGSAVETEYRSIIARNQAIESHLDSTVIVHGPCFAFEKTYFSPIAEDTIADDTAIGFQIRRKGARMIMDPAMTFAETGVSDIRARRTRKDRRAFGLLQQLGRHRDLLGRCGRFGRVVLPANWWFMVIAPWLSAIVAVLLILGAVIEFGLLGLIVPIAGAGYVALGHTDRLGPLQSTYAVVDANLSLILAMMRLVMGPTDGTWTMDVESRDQLKQP